MKVQDWTTGIASPLEVTCKTIFIFWKGIELPNQCNQHIEKGGGGGEGRDRTHGQDEHKRTGDVKGRQCTEYIALNSEVFSAITVASRIMTNWLSLISFWSLIWNYRTADLLLTIFSQSLKQGAKGNQLNNLMGTHCTGICIV